jgi:hypothetical protein
VFDSTRNGAVRVLVALLFAAPAALAGYVAPEFMLRRHQKPLGNTAIGFIFGT